MKILLLLIVILSLSCNSTKLRPYTVYTAYGSGWNLSTSNIACDSVKLYNAHHARVYIDGSGTDVYAERILISH